MKVYILIGVSNIDVRDDRDEVVETYQSLHNHSVYPTRADARSALSVCKACNEWGWDDYDIEEHDL